MGAKLDSVSTDMPVYLNTCDPFTGVLVGVQGSGKSYTMASIVEACMLVRLVSLDACRISVSYSRILRR